MKILELFAGSRSIGRNAESLGKQGEDISVFSVDWQKFDGIDLVMDIEHLTPAHIPFIPDLIWMSPDCATYSLLSLPHHRNGLEPRSDYAKKCDKVNENALTLIDHYLNVNPRLIFYIENPTGILAQMPFMLGIPKTRVWYCKYGDNRAKPTHIFSNNIYSIFNPYGWIPRPECFNGNTKCHHEAAPRGSTTGTQGKKGKYEKSRIPDELCLDILRNAIERQGKK